MDLSRRTWVTQTMEDREQLSHLPTASPSNGHRGSSAQEMRDVLDASPRAYMFDLGFTDLSVIMNNMSSRSGMFPHCECGRHHRSLKEGLLLPSDK